VSFPPVRGIEKNQSRGIGGFIGAFERHFDRGEPARSMETAKWSAGVIKRRHAADRALLTLGAEIPGEKRYI
jgi:hypothetical protein